MERETIPDIEAIVDPLIGLPYAQYNCWTLLRHLFQAGWDLDLDMDPAAAMVQAHEIWFAGDAADPLTLVQAWDVLIFRTRGMASSHVGVGINGMQFVHTRPRGGVCLETVKRWHPRLLQLARLKRLV